MSSKVVACRCSGGPATVPTRSRHATTTVRTPPVQPATIRDVPPRSTGSAPDAGCIGTMTSADRHPAGIPGKEAAVGSPDDPRSHEHLKRRRRQTRRPSPRPILAGQPPPGQPPRHRARAARTRAGPGLPDTGLSEGRYRLPGSRAAAGRRAAMRSTLDAGGTGPYKRAARTHGHPLDNPNPHRESAHGIPRRRGSRPSRAPSKPEAQRRRNCRVAGSPSVPATEAADTGRRGGSQCVAGDRARGPGRQIRAGPAHFESPLNQSYRVDNCLARRRGRSAILSLVSAQPGRGTDERGCW